MVAAAHVDMHAGYAKPVADVLDPDGTIFAARLYRCSCAGILGNCRPS